MAGTFQRTSPGAPLAIPAEVYNRGLATIEYVERTRLGGASRDLISGRDRSVVLVKNGTGGDLGAGSILGLASLAVTRDDSEGRFLFDAPLFNGDTPSAADAGAFAVLVQPVADGAVGRAVVAGLVAVRVAMVDESHRWAEVGTSTDLLTSGITGSARLLWIEDVADRDESDEAWCLARLGSDPPYGVAVPMVVDSSAAISGESYRWEYTLRAAEWDGDGDAFAEIVSGTTVTAYNMREMLNTGTVVDGLARTDSLRTLTPTAVPDGTPVAAFAWPDGGTVRWAFSAPYPLNPACVT